MHDEIEFRVLGPVEAVRAGTPLRLSGSRQRALLSLLLLDAGRRAQLASDVGSRWWEAGMLAELADLSLDAGDIDDGEDRARRVLGRARATGDRSGMVFGVGLMARVAAERGQAERALWLWAVESEDAGAPLGGWRRHRERYRERIAQLLPDAPGSVKVVPSLDEAVLRAMSPPADPGEVASAVR